MHDRCNISRWHKHNYGYNEVGFTTTMTDKTGTIAYQYDDMQRLVSPIDAVKCILAKS